MSLIRIGDRGPAVAEVRARLARLGLLPGSRFAEESLQRDRLRQGPLEQEDNPAAWSTTQLISADFDEEVEAAVRTFQRERGITADGIVGPETFRRLEEARWQLGDRALAYAAGHPTSGEDVLELQSRLNAMGFSCGKEDGSFGPATDRAVREFQSNLGLRSDGVCGPNTYRSLGQLRRTVGQESSQEVRDRIALQNTRTGIQGKIVVLDPGATSANPSIEACRLCADVAGRLERRLIPLGAHVVVTTPIASGDTSPPEEADRARICNELNADLVISLTAFSQQHEPTGISAYYFGRDGGSHSVPGKMMAAMLLEELAAGNPLASAGPQPRTWDILRNTRMPAVRIAIGNTGDVNDSGALSQPQHLDSLASVMNDTIVRFFAP